MTKKRKVALISVSIDLGAGRRGVDMGPSAIRVAGLGKTLRELGYEVDEIGTVNAEGPENVEIGDARAKYLDEITRVCARTKELVGRALERGCRPLILGGDHSLAMGTVPAIAGVHASRGERIGLIWVDAHADMNNPRTTPSGNVHGMALAALVGHASEGLGELGAEAVVHPEHVSILGARRIDEEEREVVKASGVRVFTMSEIDERGMAACMGEAIGRATDGTAGFHLSVDLDSLDPMVAPGVGTPVPGGLTFREAHLACEKIARSGRLLGLEVVELNPVLDMENRTARLAVGLIGSALGKTIL